MARTDTGGFLAWAALGLAVAMAVVIGIALGFEHIGGYMPCELCLKERIPYYVGVPVMLAAFVAALAGAPTALTRGLIAIGGIAMLVGAGLSIYHAGVEWHFWPGPSSCTGTGDASSDAGNLLESLDTVTPPSCDTAAGRFLGLSFSGWNVVATLVLAALAFAAALRGPRASGVQGSSSTSQ
ncbi:disulfide bond formation protein B [Pararhizobium mangrovi]|uniref:Disulfide bond formation protein B n=1 Tax=Pararhizobium mangrovi TaxID=2590452 RepID=A0A506TXP2_9HYPH|nr:disulfide bond formation protein B [Pararhizobium mangrovi]TPW25948.1 disulfide bond formation protein B [Pararhizobium mangrovi]